jgi:hypothetical protein
VTKVTCLEVAAAAGLEGRRHGKEQAFHCPRHEDKTPSLKINPDKDVWMCGPCGDRARGTAWQLAAFLAGHDPADKEAVKTWLREHGLLGGNGNRARPSAHTAAPENGARAGSKTRDDTPGRMVAAYDYRPASGVLLYQSVRKEPKDFLRRRPDGHGGWIWNLEGVGLIPFALDRLVDRTPDVFVPEGEKDAKACWDRHVPATTNIGGAGQWLDTYSEQLKTEAGVERAYILPDHDVPGHRHAQQVAASLHRVGIEVRIVLLPELHEGPPEPAHGRDISDWFAGHTADELRRYASEAPVWTPPAPPTPAHWQRLDLADLADWPCDPLEPIVEGWFARRTLVYVAAETQTGKTLLFLYVLWRSVHGGRLFDRYAVTPVERVAYLVLEDPARRIRDRFVDMAKEFPTPVARERCVLHIAPGFTLTDEKFWAWLEHIIATERRQLVILDTYQRATPGVESFDDKAQGPILHRLAELPRRFDVTIIVIDHVRKRANTGRRRSDIGIDDIKGSGGKAQNADAVILLARTPDRKQLTVQVFGKDFDEPIRILLRVAPKGSADPKFTYIGDLAELGTSNREKGEATRKRILDALLPRVWTGVPELVRRLELARSTIQEHLKHLVTIRAVEVDGDRKFYRYRRVAADVDAGQTASPGDAE